MARPSPSEVGAAAGKLEARLGVALAALLFVLGLAVMLQQIVLHPRAWSLGDNGDGLVVVATLEHWWRALNGVAVGGSWRQAGFFFPVFNPTGLTDSYLGLAIPYCLFRFCLVGPFSSFTAAMSVFATIGYWTGYGFCRASGLANRPAAALAASIFAFGAVTLFLAAHAQTFTIMLAPTVGLCLLRAWRCCRLGARAAWGLLAGLVYGLILLSAPQTAWFTTLVGGLVLAVYLLLRWPGVRSLPPALPQAAGFVAGALIGLALTMAVARPLDGPIKRRELGEIYFYSPHVRDIIRQPLTEIFWNDLAGRAGLVAKPGRPLEELAFGYGPILLLTLGCGCCVVVARWWRWPRDRAGNAVVLACVTAPLLCWLMEVPLVLPSVWCGLVVRLPGGALIRTPFRSQDACLMFALLGLAGLFTRLTANGPRLPLRSAVAGSLFVLLLLEQVSSGVGARHTAAVATWLAQVGHPPAPCRSFYVVAGSGPPAQWFVYQSEAMVLAQWIGLPTLNGNSSWYPDGWDMRDPAQPGYAAAVQAWIARNGLKDVCRLDASSAQWTLEASPPAG